MVTLIYIYIYGIVSIILASKRCQVSKYVTYNFRRMLNLYLNIMIMCSYFKFYITHIIQIRYTMLASDYYFY